MSEKKSFRIDVLLARESPSGVKQWSSWSPSNSPHSNSQQASLSPPISPGSEPTSVQSNSPVHSHGSGGGHNNNNDNHSDSHLSHGHLGYPSRGALNGSFGLLMESCSDGRGGGGLGNVLTTSPPDFPEGRTAGLGGTNGSVAIPGGNPATTTALARGNGANGSSQALHGPALFGSLHSYMSSSGLNHFGSASAFHLPSLVDAEGKSGSMMAGAGSGPSTPAGVSGFVGLSVANAHQLQLEWLARNGMLYPRLPELAGTF